MDPGEKEEIRLELETAQKSSRFGRKGQVEMVARVLLP
jgi:hypothetical protein